MSSAPNRRQPRKARDDLRLIPIAGDALPPQSIEAEQGVLGAILFDASALPDVAAILKPDHFWRDDHQVIFHGMLELLAQGIPVDGITLGGHLADGGNLDRIGGFDALADLANRAPSAANVVFHAGIVREKAARRRIIESADLLRNAAYADSETADVIRANAIARLASIPSTSGPGNAYSGISNDDLGIVSSESLEPEAIAWLWTDRIAKGKCSLLAGEGGDGKSTLVMQLVASITTGKPLPDATMPGDTGVCLLLGAEDGQRDTIIPRLIAAEADRSKTKIITARVATKSRDGKVLIDFKSFQDLDYWEEIIARIGDVRLLVADPIPAFLGRGVDDHRNGEIRAVMEPFLALLDRLGVALIGISHLGKSADLKTPTHKILGSVAYGNLARTVHITARDPDNKERRILFQCKTNNGPMQPALAYRIEEAVIIHGEIDIRTSRAVFEDGPVDMDARETLNAGSGSTSKRRGPTPEKTRKVAEWLHDYLAEAGEPVPFAKVIDSAGDAGHAGVKQADGKWSIPTTLYRAKDSVSTLESPRDGWSVGDGKFPVGPGGALRLHWFLKRESSEF